MIRPAHDEDLVAALTESQRLGMLGRRPIVDVVAHAEAFVQALVDTSGVVVDLGTGGGVPGLVIAARRPDLQLVLVDRRATRTDHVRRLVRRLGWADRVAVVTSDTQDLRSRVERFDAAVARGLGPPAMTLREGAGLVVVGGLVVISEPPPGTQTRWGDVTVDVLGVRRVDSPDPAVATFRRI